VSGRLERARRLERTARRAEDAAAAELLSANLELRQAEDDYRQVLERTAELTAAPLAPGLRSLLVGSGARAQTARAEERDRLREVAAEHRQRWDAARTRTRSMEKLVERAIRDRDRRRAAAERAEMTDLIAARAASAAAHGVPASRVPAGPGRAA
jgi:hypothetical protein